MTEADRAAVAQDIGLTDEGAILTESFTQWVIEDDFAGPRPRWEVAGAQFVRDVSAYEAAKLRMLNGARRRATGFLACPSRRHGPTTPVNRLVHA